MPRHRALDDERLAFFHFWREVGRRMNIREIPADRDAFERFNVDYERANFRYTDESRRVAEATRAMLLDWFLPRPLHRLGAPAVHALMDERLLAAFGFPDPGPRLRRMVKGALRLRSRVVRMMSERRRPRLRSEMRHLTYPAGYRTEELGPPPPGQSVQFKDSRITGPRARRPYSAHRSRFHFDS